MTEPDSGGLTGSGAAGKGDKLRVKRAAQPRPKQVARPDSAKAAPAQTPAAAPRRAAGAVPDRAPKGKVKARADRSPDLSDWLSLVVIALMVALAALIYQWREQPGAHAAPMRLPAAAQLTAAPWA